MANDEIIKTTAELFGGEPSIKSTAELFGTIPRPDHIPGAKPEYEELKIERPPKPPWWKKYSGLIERTLGGVYGSSARHMAALDKLADFISEKTGLEKGGIFEKISSEQAYLSEKLKRTPYGGGVPGEVAAGLGQAAFDIPAIMTFGKYGLPIHGGLMGLAEEGAPGAVYGATIGALTHKILGGIGLLPSKARIPAFMGFGAVTTPGDIKEKTAGGLTWSVLGMTGGNKKLTVREFLKAYPKIENKLYEKRANWILKKLNPDISVKEIKEAGGAKVVLDEVVSELEHEIVRAKEPIELERPKIKPEIEYIKPEQPKAEPGIEYISHGAEAGWSPEAVERAKTIKFYLLDTRTKKARPILGVDAVDVSPNPYELKLQKNLKTEQVELLDRGERAKILPFEEVKKVLGIEKPVVPEIRPEKEVFVKEEPLSEIELNFGKQIQEKILKGEEFTPQEKEIMSQMGMFKEEKPGIAKGAIEAKGLEGVEETPTPEETREIWSGLPVPKRIREAPKKTVEKIVDWLQVEPRFRRMGAPETGLAAKTYYERRNMETEKYIKTLKEFTKTKYTKEDFQEATWLQAKPEKAITPERKKELQPIVDKFTKIQKEYEAKLKKAKVFEYGFPENKILNMRIERMTLNTQLKDKNIEEAQKLKIRKRINELNKASIFLNKYKVKYVHVPRTWLEDLFDKRPDDTPRILTQFYHERQTLDIEQLGKYLIKKGIITKEDTDIRTIWGAYVHQAGHKLALAEIFNNATKEGLIKNAEKAPAGWQRLPRQIFPGIKGKRVHPAFADFLEKNFTNRGFVPPEIGYVLGTIKMLQFYNPLFLPAYDIWQGFWTGSVRSTRTPASIGKAFTSMLKKDQSYWDMHYWGGFSTPFTPTFKSFTKEVKRVTDNQPFLKRALTKYGVNPQRISWEAAWAGDHFIRMITYHHYIGRGFVPQEAAQLTAKAHGDYASIPTGTRRILNKIFFTPSFKIAMMAAQADMTKQMGRYIVRSKTQTRKERATASMLVGLAGGIIMRNWILNHLGFKTDKFALKYVKTIDTPEGKKELVLHTASPDNVYLRYYHRFKPILTEPDKLFSFLERSKWELHPLWQLGMEVSANQSVAFEPIYNNFDNPAKISKDISLYSIRRILRVTEQIKGMEESTKRLEAQKLLVKDVGKVGVILNFFVLPYTRNPEEVRTYYKMKQLINAYKRMELDKPAKNTQEADTRLENLRKKLRKLQESFKND